MQTLGSLKNKLKSAEDLSSIVSTMKGLAAVSIRQYERAADALAEYNRTIELGFQVLLKQRFPATRAFETEETARFAAVIFGSDQGMCGQFNDQVAEFAKEQMRERDADPGKWLIMTVGARLLPLFSYTRYQIDQRFMLPGTVKGMTGSVSNILVGIESWRTQHQLGEVRLFHNVRQSAGSYKPVQVHLLPLDRRWFTEIAQREWPTNMLPLFRMEWGQLLSMLVRQYLFVSIYRALAESAASENASRLSSMQAAENNIQEQTEELTKRYHQKRQQSITEELQDIVSGFESLSEKR